MTNEKNMLTEGNVGKALLKFSLPFLLSSFLQAFYGAADLFVVGRYSGSSAVSAVATGSQLMQTLTGIILGISMGGTVLIGRLTGEGNKHKAAKAIGTLIILFCIISLMLTLAVLSLTDWMILLMHTPPEAAESAKTYIIICACGIPFIVGYNAVSGIFRGIGDSRTPVYFITLACIINIAGDFLLTGYFNMGASGAAIATISAQAVSFLASLCYMVRKGPGFPFCRKDIRFDAKSALYILKVGFPLALQDALVNISFLIITAIINTMGLTASAAVGVVEKVIGFTMLPSQAFASAIATMTAQNIGAGKKDRALKALWLGISFSLVFAVGIVLYIQILPQSITSIFSKDSYVIQAAADYLQSYSFDCLLVSFVFCINSFFSGSGNSVIPFIHSMAATFCVRIPLTWMLSLQASGGLYIMGFAAPAATALSLVICLLVLRKNKRQ